MCNENQTSMFLNIFLAVEIQAVQKSFGVRVDGSIGRICSNARIVSEQDDPSTR